MEIIDGSEDKEEYHVVGYVSGDAPSTMLEFYWDRRPSYLEEHEGDRELAELDAILENEVSDILALEPGDEGYE